MLHLHHGVGVWEGGGCGLWAVYIIGKDFFALREEGWMAAISTGLCFQSGGLRKDPLYSRLAIGPNVFLAFVGE